jgi:2-methylcitrate dehydratase PrpD
MAEVSSTKSFLNWMYSTGFDDIPQDVRNMAVLALYDGIGCNLACSLLPTAHRMVDFVNQTGGAPDCTMMGFPMRTSLVNAAMVNGTLGHGDEMDAHDGDGRGTHILAATMAAALTSGQLVGATGLEVLRGVVLGYELSKRIVRVANRVERETGKSFGPVDAGNTMGATAASGITLGLPPDRLDVALGLAAHMSCNIAAYTRETAHMTASFLRGGVGARNGVTAALMAKVGYDAPRDIFDTEPGFFSARLGIQRPGPEFLETLGEDYGITGLIFKRQNAGGGNHVARLVLLELMTEHGLSASDIAEIQAELVPRRGIHHHSGYGESVLALAAVYGGVGLREAYNERYYNAPEVRAMQERVKISDRDEWAGFEDRFYAGVTVTTKDGRKFSNESNDRQMTEAELDAKFSHLVGLRAGDAKAKELAQVLKRLDTVSNVAEVMEQLELPEAHIGQV